MTSNNDICNYLKSLYNRTSNHMRSLSAIISTIALGVAAIVTACSGNTDERIETELRQAEMSVAQGDMVAAQSVADHVLNDTHTYQQLTPRQLGRLSLVYMQLSDSTDQAGNVSSAISCFRKAYTDNPDSAAAFYATVPAEHTTRAIVLATITHAIDNPSDSTAIYSEEPDSIPTGQQQ